MRACSHYSFGWGASSPEELLDRAAHLGIGALALADVDTMAGVVDFVAAARARGIQPLPAATLTVPEGHLVLLPRGPAGRALL